MARLIDITGKAVSGEWGFDDETGDGIPVIRTTNFTNDGVVNYNDIVTRKIIKKNLDEKYLRKGDIIIEKSGGSDKFPVGRVIYFDGEENTYLFNNFTGLLRVKNQELWYTKYVFYSLFFNYKRGGTRAFENKTTGLHNLKTDEYVRRYEVTERSRNEQILICEKLDRAYSIIKSRQLELLLLDELIKARFVELFGDPASNEKGWMVKDLETVTTIVTYGLTVRPDYIDEGIDLVSARELHKGYVAYEEAPKISEEDFEKLSEKGKPHINDILFSKTGSIGHCALVEDDKPFAITQNAARIGLKTDLVNPLWLLYYLRMDFIQDWCKGHAKGNAVKDFQLQDMKVIPLFDCPFELQKQFADFVQQVDKSKVAVQKALDESQILFDSLMQKYFG